MGNVFFPFLIFFLCLPVGLGGDLEVDYSPIRRRISSWGLSTSAAIKSYLFNRLPLTNFPFGEASSGS